MNPEWRSRYETALTATRAAGKHALSYFDNNVAVEWKKDRSPVTAADREAETLIRTTLSTAFPGDGFLGEEHGELPSTTGYRWVIDPVDGTKSFVRGIPLWGTLVGLEYKGEPIAGIASMPALNGTTFHALRGLGAWRDDRRIHVSTIDNLADAMLCYSSISWFTSAQKERQFLTLAAQTNRQRGYGDLYGFLLVAQGSAEMMVEHGVSPWDIAALIPIVEEAGGRMTNWSEVTDIHSRDVIASNGKLHAAVLSILRGNSN
jgi:histidinol-phosphatase